MGLTKSVRRVSARALKAGVGAGLVAAGLVAVPLLVGDTYGAVSCSAAGGVLTIDMTAAGDSVTIDRVGTDIVLTGDCALTTAMSVLESIDVNGSAGNQTVTINLDNGAAGGEVFEPAADGTEAGETWFTFAGNGADEIEFDIDLAAGGETTVTGRTWQTGDRVIFEGDADSDFLTFAGSTSTATRMALGNDHGAPTGDDTDPDFFFFNVEQIEVRGNASADTVNNGNTNTNVGGAAADRSQIPLILLGGAGSDVLNAGNVNDLIDGGADNDPTLGGAQGEDILVGGAGVDGSGGTVFGDNGNDVIVGGAGNDVNLRGADGEDYYWEGDCYNGAAQVACGSGGDTHNGTDAISALTSATAGIDTLSYWGRSASITASFTSNVCTATSAGLGQAGENDSAHNRTENLVGGTGADTLTMTDTCTTDTAENRINPGDSGSLAADDTITGNGGGDTVDYGPGMVGRSSAVPYTTLDPIAVNQFVSWALQQAAHTATAGVGYTVFEVVPSGASSTACDGTFDGAAGHNLDADGDATNNDGVVVDLSTAGAQETYCAGDETFSGINGAIGSLFNDRLTGNSSANHLHGLDGNDFLDGSTGAENTALTQGIWTQLTTQTGTHGVPILPSVSTKNCTACSSVVTGFGMTGGKGTDFIRGGDGADNMAGGDGDDTFDQPIQADPTTDPDNMSGGNHTAGDTVNYATIGRVNPWRATREGRLPGALNTTVTITGLAASEVTALAYGFPGTANDGEISPAVEADNVWSDVELPRAPAAPTIADPDSTFLGADGRDFQATWTLDASLKTGGATPLTEQRVYVLPENTPLDFGTHTAIAGWTFTGANAQIEPTNRVGTASTTKNSAGTRFPTVGIVYEVHVVGFIGNNVVSYNPTVGVAANGAGGAFFGEAGGAGAPAKVVFTEQPSNVTAGQVISPSVVAQVQDAASTPCTDAALGTVCTGGANAGTSDPDLGFVETITIDVEPGTPTSGGAGNVVGGTVTGTIDWSCGCATFSNITMSKIGTAYKFRGIETFTGATSPLTNATGATASGAFNVTGGAPASLNWSVQPATPTQPGTNFSVTVQVLDSLGNLAAEPSATLTERIHLQLDDPDVDTVFDDALLDGGGNGDNQSATTQQDVVWATSSVTFTGLNVDEVGTPYKLRAFYDENSTTGGQQAGGVADADSAAFEIAATGSFVFTDPAADGGTKTAGNFNVVVQLQTTGPAEVVTDPDGDGNVESVRIVCTHTDTVTVFTNQDSSSPITNQSFPFTGAAGGGTVTFPVRATKAGSYSCVTSNPTNFNANPSAGARTIVVVAGPAHHPVFSTQPTANSSYASTANITGNTNPFAVQIVDEFNNSVADAGRAVTITFVSDASGGTASIQNGVVSTGAGGLATFGTMKVTKVGDDYTIQGTTVGLTTNTTGTSVNFDIVAGPASKLGFVQQPSNTVVNTVMAPAVTVRLLDANDNPVTTAGVAISVANGTTPAGGSAAGGTLTANTNASGVSTFSTLTWSATGTGYTLTATSAGLTPATSTTFNITAGAPVAQKLVIVGQPATGSNHNVNTAIAPCFTVQVQSNDGTLIAGDNGRTITIVINTNAGPGVITTTVTAVTVNGVATFCNVRIDTVGTGYDVIFTTPGLSSTPPSNAFNIIAAPAGGGGGAPTPPTTVVAPPDRQPIRIAGEDRTETAEFISRVAFPDGAEVVYIATDQEYADALSAGPGAVDETAPILLTPRDSLDPNTAAELTRLRPHRIVVVGGWAAVSDEVKALLTPFASEEVVRVAGDDRFGTAAEISKDRFPDGSSTVYLATGRSYPDALAGGLAASGEASPVLLTEPNVLPEVTSAEILRLQPERVIIIGGAGAIARGIEALLADYAPVVERIAGEDRYETTAAVNNLVVEGTDTVFIVTGKTFGDALTGIPIASMTGSAVLMVGDGPIHALVIAELERLQPRTIIVLGGTAAVAERVEAQLATYMGEGTGDGERGLQIDEDTARTAIEEIRAGRSAPT